MKRIGLLVFSLLLLTACDDGGEKKAQLRLQNAQEALAGGDFNEAKLQIDSIKLLYPKAFEARKQGIALMQQVELKEQQQTLMYLDSMLQQKEKEFEAIKGNYVLEKDTAYQDIGNYFYPSQTVEKNINRTYLRAQVNERGQMALTSIYCGSGNIHHTAVKVSVKDGSFAQTPVSKDIYETSDLGVKTEKADYKLGDDGNVIGFITINKDNNIKVEYLGDRNYTTTMSPSDRLAVAEVYNLAQILASIEGIKKEMKEANLKIEFVTRKIQERNSGGAKE